MGYIHNHKALVLLALTFCFLLIFVAIEFLIITYSGTPIAAPSISRQPQTAGTGQALTYAILGDSTAIGQGGEYNEGIAVSTARFLAAKGYQVTYQNLGVSGARLADVRRSQAAQAVASKPDIVLVSAGANDVTHLTRLKHVQGDLQQIITMLRAANPGVKIILTGAPEMGAIPRFPQPAKYAAKLQTAKVNAVFAKVASENDVIFAQIAKKTGPIFIKNPGLFAADRFHPNKQGYAVWIPVLEEALTTTFKR